MSTVLYLTSSTDASFNDIEKAPAKISTCVNYYEGAANCNKPPTLPPPPAAWDKSSLEIGCEEGGCNYIQALITNNGSNMAGTVPYEVRQGTKTGPVVKTGVIPALNKGKSYTLRISPIADGKYFIIIQQRPGHPGNSQPTVAATAKCGGKKQSSLSEESILEELPEADAEQIPVVDGNSGAKEEINASKQPSEDDSPKAAD